MSKIARQLAGPARLDCEIRRGCAAVWGDAHRAARGRTCRFDEQQIVELGRNFCNKLWNACRFRMLQGPVDPEANPFRHELSIFAKNLLSMLHEAICRIETGYANYRFSEIAQTLYDFVWSEFCDRFIEAAKADLGDPARKAGTLATTDYTLRRVLLLLHPFTPFVTEELWHGLGFGPGSVQFAGWPQAEEIAREPNAEAVFRAATLARTLRANYNIPSNRRLRWLVQPQESWVTAELAVLRALLNAESVEPVDGQPAGAAACPTEIGVIFLPLEGIIDSEAERNRLEGEMAKVRGEIEKVERELLPQTHLFRMRRRKSYRTTAAGSKPGLSGWKRFAWPATRWGDKLKLLEFLKSDETRLSHGFVSRRVTGRALLACHRVAPASAPREVVVRQGIRFLHGGRSTRCDGFDSSDTRKRARDLAQRTLGGPSDSTRNLVLNSAIPRQVSSIPPGGRNLTNVEQLTVDLLCPSGANIMNSSPRLLPCPITSSPLFLQAGAASASGRSAVRRRQSICFAFSATGHYGNDSPPRREPYSLGPGIHSHQCGSGGSDSQGTSFFTTGKRRRGARKTGYRSGVFTGRRFCASSRQGSDLRAATR